MLDNFNNNRYIYCAVSVFVAIICVSIYFEFYYSLALPLLILTSWLMMRFPGYILIGISFFTPLSLNIAEYYDIPVGLNIPSEPLLIALTLLIVFLILGGFKLFSIRFDHSIISVVLFQLAWMSLTVITSELPMVSLKYLVARSWFVLPCLFFGTYFFQNVRSFYYFSIAFLMSCSGVVVYTVIRHSGYGFDKDSAHWVMEPMFRDHTVYGAVLALILPVNVGLLFIRTLNPVAKFFLRVSLVILLVGIVFSYTRAAWISLVAGLILLAVLYFRIKVGSLIVTAIVVSIILFMSWERIMMSMAKNKQESSDKIEEHIGSISNVSSDASNLERINRWSCAWKMFLERPITGWGAGTYQFVYAPFQMSKDRTIISTNQGDGGNAHSEYLGPLCEQGLPGALGFVLLVIVVVITSFRLFNTLEDADTRIIVSSCFIGLSTYFVHGVLNNFLDSDKAAVPFWSMLAMIVSADLYGRKRAEV